MPRYPGSADPSVTSFAGSRRLIDNAINSLDENDRRHLLNLLQTDYVDDVEVSRLEGADGEEYASIRLSSVKGVELRFFELKGEYFDDDVCFVRVTYAGVWQGIYIFREMKKAVNYFIDKCDERIA